MYSGGKQAKDSFNDNKKNSEFFVQQQKVGQISDFLDLVLCMLNLIKMDLRICLIEKISNYGSCPPEVHHSLSLSSGLSY